MCIFLLGACFFITSFAMDIPFEPLTPKVDLIPQFEPSKEAAKYQPLQRALINSNFITTAPDIPYEKKYVFVECMNQLRANISMDTLKFVLEDPTLVEAVITYAQPYTLRNEYIQLFFFSSLMYENDAVYSLLLDKKIDLVNLRSGLGQTPAQFLRWLYRKNE